MKKIGICTLILLVVVVGGYLYFLRCTSGSTTAVTSIEQIELRITAVKQMPAGMMYTVSLTNGSPHVIKQNTVYISYPMIQGNTSSLNNCKVEATGNKLNIQPGTSVTLNALMPKEDYENNTMLDKQHPTLEINGYLDDVKETSHFDKSGGARLP